MQADTRPLTKYALALKRLGIETPIEHDRSNVGTLLDAKGNGFAVVDMNRELSDEAVNDIAELIAAAVNLLVTPDEEKEVTARQFNNALGLLSQERAENVRLRTQLASPPPVQHVVGDAHRVWQIGARLLIGYSNAVAMLGSGETSAVNELISEARNVFGPDAMPTSAAPAPQMVGSEAVAIQALKKIEAAALGGYLTPDLCAEIVTSALAFASEDPHAD